MRHRLGAKARSLIEFFGGEILAYLASGIVTGVLLAGVELVFAYGLQAFLLALRVADPASVTPPDWVPRAEISHVLAFLFGLTLLRGALQFSQVYTQNATMEKFKHLQRSRLLRWTFESRSASSSQVTTLFSERVQLGSGCIGYIQSALLQLCMITLIGANLVRISPPITLVLAGCLLAFAPGVRGLNRSVARTGKGLAVEWEKTNHRLLLSIKNLFLIRVYGTRSREEALAGASMRAYIRHMSKQIQISGLLFVLPQVLGMGVICLAAFLAHRESWLQPGVLLSYFYLFVRLMQTVSTLNQSVSSVLFYRPQLQEVYAWWQRSKHERLKQESRAALRSERSAPPIDAPAGWELERVTFSFSPESPPLFQDARFDFPAGKASVILGPSGAGKSTLLSLMIGELSPGAGAIHLVYGPNRIPLDEAREQLLPRLGYVGPESFVFDGTVRENLFYGLTRTPEEGEVREALRLAECSFVDELPAGLEHRLTEQGHGLSAGQKQRLSLARALLRRPAALFLDEATANLDSDTERKLIATLAALKGRMTLIIVTHREGLLAIADQVIRLGPQR